MVCVHGTLLLALTQVQFHLYRENESTILVVVKAIGRNVIFQFFCRLFSVMARSRGETWTDTS